MKRFEKMKRTYLFIVIALFIGKNINAQFSHLKDVELKTSEDFEEFAELVVDCSNYLLMTPFDKKDSERAIATDFITRWIKGSPSVNFNLSENVKQLTDDREDLIGIYITCYAQKILESDIQAPDYVEIEKEAIVSFLQYCNRADNKIKPTKEMKKDLAST